jgi:ATP-dependent RNA helicase DeaD
MSEPDFAGLLGPALAGALEKRGFTELTAVQKTVLDPALAGRDLRITSQTGSGKTVAVGFALRDLVADGLRAEGGVARPRAMVVAPTRELAKQVEEELSWLFAPLKVRVASATGGASVRDERRALAAGPAVIVGTPGRLLDHLTRGAIDASQVGAVVLDEADRLLDMGFREELEAILEFAPEGHRTHLVSATFPREVRALADSVQGEVAHVQGTKLGEANADIDHVLHLVDARDRLGAIINLLLANPDEQMLVFARTRADVGDIADALVSAGFAASSLSGEMEQPARDRALAAFKRGDLRVLVATDVAARGIDVQDIGRVLHADPPGDADTYTHRSGRTGRAGRKGISAVLVPPSVMAKVIRLMQRAGVPFRFERLPGAAEIRQRSEERAFETLASDEGAGGPAPDERALALAERLAQAGNVPRTIARLLMRARQATGPEPRDIRMIQPPSEAPRATRRGVTGKPEGRPMRSSRFEPRQEFGDRGAEQGDGAQRFDPDRPRFDSQRPPRFDSDRPRFDSQRPPRFDSDRPRFDSDRPPPSSQRFDSPRAPRDLARDWAQFQVSWGEVHGADSRRMLAMLCRRGGIGSGDVGAIRIGHVASTVEVARDVAEQFAEAAGKTDLRDPRIVIRPMEGGGPAAAKPAAARPAAVSEPARGKRRVVREPGTEQDVDVELAAEATPPKTTHARTTHAKAPHAKAPYTKAPHAKTTHTKEDAAAGPRSETRPPKGKGAPPRYPAGKTKGWVKKPSSRAVSAGDAPPKRRRIV